MSIRVLGGEQYNILATGESVTVTSENTLFPKENLPDGRPDSPFMFNASSTTDTITVDGALGLNGSLDTWNGNIPQGWSISGNIVEATSSTEVRSGSAAKVFSGDFMEKDYTVRAGQRVVLSGWYRLDSSGIGSALGALQNLNTGRVWTGSSWSDQSQEFFTSGTTAITYTEYGPDPIDVEDFDDVREDTCTLRLRLIYLGGAATSGNAFFDDWYLWPSVDFASIHGHNIQAVQTVKLRSATDNFASTSNITDQATLTPIHPSFYTVLSSARDDRYWQIIISTSFTPTVTNWIGELVIGQTETLSRQFNYGSRVQLIPDHISSRTISGAKHVYRVGQTMRRALSMTFDYFTSGEYGEGKNFFERAGGDATPIVIVPDTDENVVIHGRLEPSFGADRTLEDDYTGAEVTVIEDPFPVIVS